MHDAYLSVMSFRADASARALIEVLDPRDTARAIDTHHRLVWSLFAREQGSEDVRDFLWRYDAGQFLMLSRRVPADRHGLFDIRTSRFLPSLKKGTRLRFRLRANATVCRTENVNGRKVQKRHDIVYDAVRARRATNPDERPNVLRDELAPTVASRWLAEAGRRGGFELASLTGCLYSTMSVQRPGSRPAQFGVLDMDGLLDVVGEQQFRAALMNGMGRAKSFGCGLMLVMPD